MAEIETEMYCPLPKRAILHTDILGINKLIDQLTEGSSSKPKPIDFDRLCEMIISEGFEFLVVRDSSKDAVKESNIVGMGLISFRETMTKYIATIDDVVVLKEYRGQGLGERIMCKLISLAKGYGADCIELTSKPEREPANKLYLKLGFVKRDTNVYRMTL